MSKDPLGDRMKANYEDTTRFTLPRRTYTIMRLDGRAFHGFTKGMERPFDQNFADCMDMTASKLCKEISGSVFSYTQSDEISILMQDFESTGTQPWFGGNIQKMVSIAAGIASVFFHAVLAPMEADANHGFDARVFTIADPVEVANYFIWRQRDAVRNSISMAGQAHFSPAVLHGKSTGEVQELLHSRVGVNWNDFPDGFKRGRVCLKETYFLASEEYGTTERNRWVSSPAPHFVADLGDDLFLSKNIPALPSFKEL